MPPSFLFRSKCINTLLKLCLPLEGLPKLLNLAPGRFYFLSELANTRATKFGLLSGGFPKFDDFALGGLLGSGELAQTLANRAAFRPRQQRLGDRGESARRVAQQRQRPSQRRF